VGHAIHNPRRNVLNITHCIYGRHVQTGQY